VLLDFLLDGPEDRSSDLAGVVGDFRLELAGVLVDALDRRRVKL
jgi:hypothetical protein